MAHVTSHLLKGLFWVVGRTGKAEGSSWWFASGGFSWKGFGFQIHIFLHGGRALSPVG